MPIKMYMIVPSPPVRAVQLTSKALGITLDCQEVNLGKQEQLKEEFLQINPNHTVPTIDDNGVILWDSHAIMGYLVETYGKNDSLYPKDPKARALVNQMLHFDSSIAFDRLMQVLRPVIYKGCKEVSVEKKEALGETLRILERILNGKNYVTGATLTIADFALIATVTSIGIIVPVESTKYPNITSWILRMQSLAYYDANQRGLDFLSRQVKACLG